MTDSNRSTDRESCFAASIMPQESEADVIKRLRLWAAIRAGRDSKNTGGDVLLNGDPHD